MQRSAPVAPNVDRRDDGRRLDVIGDVHGCVDELEALLALLGYVQEDAHAWRVPAGRAALFVGDLVDRGPKNVRALRIAMHLVETGQALWVPGNHDLGLQAYLDKRTVPFLWGLDLTVEELARESKEFRRTVREFLRSLPSHYLLDEGRLVVAHAGLPEKLHGRDSRTIRHLAACGFRPGESDPPTPEKRHAWVKRYRGEAAVVHGHTPVREPQWRNNTIDIDTGCVFGGRLTALRWPERELVSVPAARVYADPPSYF